MFITPPSKLTLEANQIHVWSASLDLFEPTYESLYKTLSQDERDKAKRFVFEKDRKHFAACRGILRSILACYLNTEAHSFSFMYNAKGKPALADSYDSLSLRFNLSHSEGLALFALSRNHEIGVDVEYMHDISDMEHIAERSFSIREMEIFHSLPEAKKKKAFFNGWTRKEAFTKALGEGLSLPLDSFDVSFSPDEQACLLRIENNTNDVSQWSIKDVSTAPDYAGAFAVKNRVFETKYWQWESPRLFAS